MAPSSNNINKVIPVNISKNRILSIPNTVHYHEEIIINDMKLRRDAPGVDVEDQPNICSMFRRITKYFSLLHARIKLWNLLFILQLGIKNISHTSPDVKTTKVIIVSAFDTKPFFNWCSHIRASSVIQNRGHIVKSKRPKRDIILSWPGKS
eukprot:9320988-Ditylum_brightwellii.AAC.1